MGYGRPDWHGHAIDEIVDESEPVFVIRAQDVVSGDAVRAYADLAEKAGASWQIVALARRHARRMDDWRPKKTPDLQPGSWTDATIDALDKLDDMNQKGEL